MRSKARPQRSARHALSPPRTAGGLGRPVLEKWLDRTTKRGDAWVEGAAGTGKTWLVARWLKQTRRPAIWYRVDQLDDDPAVLFHRLASAVSTRRAARALPSYTPGCDLHAFALTFFEGFFAALPPRTVLVVDDCHAVDTNPLHTALATALDCRRVNHPMVFMSRTSPPQPFARAVVEARIARLDPAKLLLSRAEVIRLVKKQSRNIDAAAVAQLGAGWFAAIRLLLLRPARALDRPPNVQSLSADMFGYLAREVFGNVPHETRRALDIAALLSEFTPAQIVETASLDEPLAATTTDVERIFDQFCRGALFVQRLDSDRFQIHPLLRAYLLDDLERRGTQSKVREAAAIVLERSERPDQAFAVLEATRADGACRALVIRAAPALWRAGRWAIVAKLVAACPAPFEPWIGYWHACCALITNPGDALARFIVLLEEFERSNEALGAARAWCGAVQAIVHEGRDFRQIVPLLMRRHEAAWNVAALPDAVRVELCAFSLIAITYSPAPSEISEAVLAEARKVGHAATEPLARLVIGGPLVNALALSGAVDEAVAIHSTIRRFADEQPMTAATVAFDIATLRITLLRGDVDRARDVLSQGLQRLDRAGLTFFRSTMLQNMGALELGLGRRDAFKLLLAELETTSGRRLVDRAALLYLQAFGAYVDRRLPEAAGYLRVLLDAVRQLGYPFALGLALTLAARVAFERGDRIEALALLDEESRLPNDAGVIRGFAHLVAAEFALAGGDDALARRSLEQGFSRLRAGGVLSLVALHPESRVADLCAAALRHDVEVDHVRSMIRVRDLRPTVSHHDLERWPWSVRIRLLGATRVEPDPSPMLGDRQMPLRLLELLAVLGARQPSIAVSTVVDTLWPGADGDRGMQSLEVNLHRLRKALGVEGAVFHRHGQIGLQRDVVWVDLWSIWAALRAAPSARALERIEQLYRGPLCPMSDLTLVEDERKRLRSALRALLHARSSGSTSSSGERLVGRIALADAEMTAR